MPKISTKKSHSGSLGLSYTTIYDIFLSANRQSYGATGFNMIVPIRAIRTTSE